MQYSVGARSTFLVVGLEGGRGRAKMLSHSGEGSEGRSVPSLRNVGKMEGALRCKMVLYIFAKFCHERGMCCMPVGGDPPDFC